MKWQVSIEKVGNGYIIKSHPSADGETSVVEIKESTDAKDEVKYEQMAFREVCYVLKEFFTVHNDKHNDQYLYITVSGDDSI